MSMPWSKFFWSDYASDPALKLSSFAAQGLWMRMLCIAAEHDPVGFVALNGKSLDERGIARMTGGSIEEVSELLEELESNGVFNRDRRGWIYSRRLINDAKKHRNLSAAGKLGAEIKREKQKEKSQGLKGDAKPPLKGEGQPHIPEARVQEEKSIKRKLPEGFNPEPFGEGTDSAKIEAGWSEDERKLQLERFTAHHSANGSKFVDWQKAWSTWILNSVKFARPQQRSSGNGSSYLDHVVGHVIPSLEKEEADEG